MSDTEYVREKSREALRNALETGASKKGVSTSSEAVVASSSILASRIEAAMFERYGRDLSLEHSRPAANEAGETVAEEMVKEHGDLVATEAYREAVRAHVVTLMSSNPEMAALLFDGDLAPDTFAVMSPQDMMTKSMHKHAEETKKEFLGAERGYLPEKSDFVTPAQAGWDLEGEGHMDVDPDLDQA